MHLVRPLRRIVVLRFTGPPTTLRRRVVNLVRAVIMTIVIVIMAVMLVVVMVGEVHVVVCRARDDRIQAPTEG